MRALRNMARRFGVGAAIVNWRRFRQLGVRRQWEMVRSRRIYLDRIQQLEPLSCARNGLEVHMLVEKARVREALWAFRSLQVFAPDVWSLVVHDDGSLDSADECRFQEVAPGCRVIRRKVADEETNSYFKDKGLLRCRQMRDGLKFGLKLFDVLLFTKERSVLLLDSDVLFFRAPTELLTAVAKREDSRCHVYMQDVRDQYVMPPVEMETALGRPRVRAFNPGVALVPIGARDQAFQRFERYLEYPGFWKNGTVDYLSELTLWAMEMAHVEATSLPADYAIAPKAPPSADAVCCHYCGGVGPKYLFYVEGLPRVWKSLRHES